MKNQPNKPISLLKRKAFPFNALFANRTFYSHALVIVGLLAVLVLPAGCKKDDENKSTLNTQDRAFFDSAAVTNMAEIELGTLAASKAMDATVKQYGQMMVDMHTTQTNNLKPLAANKGVTLPTALNKENQDLKTQLSALTGARFDSVYVNSQVKGHTKAQINFQAEISNGSDADVKKFASDNLPAIQQHLAAAQAIKTAKNY